MPTTTITGPLPTVKEIESGMDQDSLNNSLSPSSSIHSVTWDPETSPVANDILESQLAGMAEDGVAIHASEVVLEEVCTYNAKPFQLICME